MISILKKTVFRGPIALSMVVILVGCLAYVVSIPFLDSVELKTIDLRFRMRGQQPITDKVVLAVIDEKSLKAEGRWTWPRSIMADLVKRLSEEGARVIAFDVGFFEPESSEVVKALDQVAAEASSSGSGTRELIDFLESLKYQKNNDRLLAEAIEKASAEVVLGYFFQINPDDAVHITPEELEAHSANIESGRYDVTRFTSGAARNTPLPEAVAPQSNIKKIAETTPYAGFFNKLTDPDGVVRRLPLTIRFQGNLYAPLSLKAVSAYLDEPLSILINEKNGVAKVQVGDRSIPVDDRGEMMINYRGEPKTFPHISVTDILRGNISEGRLRDKIVVVGATAIGIHDECVTPMAKVFPGPEVHPNVIDSILSRDYLYRPVWAPLLDLLILFFGGFLLAVVLARSGPLLGGVVAMAMFGGYVWLGQFFFSQTGWILNLVYPLCVLVLVYLATTSYKYFSEAGQKKFIREAFSKYLAPEVVQQLIESPHKLVLGGERREITAFFSDVQGFTSISEKLAPEELVDLLNDFLTEITDIILKHQGGVDKFEGDAAIAFFGAPNDLANHAEAACLACVDIQKRMISLREKWRREGKPELQVRIGLFSGPAVVGNMGSRNRMDYTMMGDTVNTAARLEGVNKMYGTYTMIGETTFRAAETAIAVRELDAVKVVGKAEPVKIYELLGRAGQLTEVQSRLVTLYARGLAAYRRQEWTRAMADFEEALALIPEDGPSLTMLDRCRRFMETPPDDGWDGSFSLDTK